MADRYTYIPLIGIFIIIAWFAAEIVTRYENSKKVIVIASLVILIALSFLTYIQVGYWRDNMTLYEHTVKVTKDNDIMNYNVAQLYLEKGDDEQAIKYFREAVRIRPAQPSIHKNLGILLERQGKINEAIKEYREVLIYSPDDKSVQYQLNILLSKQNNEPFSNK